MCAFFLAQCFYGASCFSEKDFELNRRHKWDSNNWKWSTKSFMQLKKKKKNENNEHIYSTGFTFCWNYHGVALFVFVSFPYLCLTISWYHHNSEERRKIPKWNLNPMICSFESPYKDTLSITLNMLNCQRKKKKWLHYFNSIFHCEWENWRERERNSEKNKRDREFIVDNQSTLRCMYAFFFTIRTPSRCQ